MLRNQGSEHLHAFFKREVERVGLKGRVRANKAGCLDHCEMAPASSSTRKASGIGWDPKPTSTEIVERHVMKGEIVERLLMPDHPAPPSSLPTP